MAPVARNTLIESLSQQKAQGEDIAEIRENVRAQRAEQALSLLSISQPPPKPSVKATLTEAVSQAMKERKSSTQSAPSMLADIKILRLNFVNQEPAFGSLKGLSSKIGLELPMQNCGSMVFLEPEKLF